MRNSSESTAMRSTRKEHVHMEIENIFQKDHFINRSKKKASPNQQNGSLFHERTMEKVRQTLK